jgi:hypothetical protein
MSPSDAGHYIDEDGTVKPCVGTVAAKALAAFYARFAS